MASKRIEVKPNSSLSLQMHRHRAEHWIIVSGTAEVEINDEKLLTENQSTFIPLGSKHRLSNPKYSPIGCYRSTKRFIFGRRYI